MDKMNNLCPVCGYDLKQPVEDSLICVCCGTQYGYHDSVLSHTQLRDKWLASGARWHSRRVLPPPHWSVTSQLDGIGYEAKQHEQREAA